MDQITSTVSLSLTLHGPFAAKVEGRALEHLSRRAQAMLAYLSQQPGMRAERGLLADLLWSDRSEDQARASLRQELSVLRRALPVDVLQATRQHVWLDADRVHVDDAEGESFLQGFDLPSEGFEDWLRARRASGSSSGDSPAATDTAIMTRPAVLLFAFEALSNGENDAMIALGLADDLRTTLSYWRWFPVIGPEAIGWKTPRDIGLRDAAAEVGAAYAVTGTLRCLGNRVKISVALTEAETGRSRWSETFEGQLDDIFAFQEEVSRAIVAQLEPQIARAEAQRVARARPATIGPWQLLAQADEIERTGGEGYGTPENNDSQERLMQEAIRQTPDFAPALARLARIWFRRGLLSWVEDTAAAFTTSLEYSDRALRADPTLWEAHAFSGLALIFGRHDYPAGEFHSAEAVRLNPSAALARHGLACALEWLGRPEEAPEHLRLIFRLYPQYPGRAPVLGQLASCEMFLGNGGAAQDAARQLLAIAPDYARGLQRCVATFGYFGDETLASKALTRLMEIQPDFDETYVRATYPYERAEHLEMLLDGFRRAGAFD